VAFPRGDFVTRDYYRFARSIVQLHDGTDSQGNPVNGKIVADAIWLRKLPDLSEGVMDNRYPGFDAGDLWVRSDWHLASDPEPYMENCRYHRPGPGSDNATWTLTGLEPGYYEMHATWTRASGRAGNAPYKVYDGVVDPANLELQADVNQKKRPNQAFYDGSMWNLLRSADGVATVYVDSGKLTVELGHDTDSQGNPVDGKVVADAIWAKKLPGVPAGVMDNEYLGYVESGTGWWTSTWNLPGRQGPYQENYRIHVGGGDGSNVATWTLDALASGTYDVYATWTSATGRASNAPYRVFDGTPSTGTLRLDVAMNQRLEANDATYDGHGWGLLGTCEVTSGTLTVQLSDNADGKVVADAIWVNQQAGGGAAASSGGLVAVARTDLQRTVTTTMAAWSSVVSYEPGQLARVEHLDSLVLGLLSGHWGRDPRHETGKSEAEAIFADEELLAAMLADR